MATRFLACSLLTTKQSLVSIFSQSYTSIFDIALSNSSPFLFHLCPLVVVASASHFCRFVPAIATTAFSTRHTTSSLNDTNPNGSNHPRKKIDRPPGCDLDYWLVILYPLKSDLTRDMLIFHYIKTLAEILGCDAEEAKMKIYSVYKSIYAFGANVSEQASWRIRRLDGVRVVCPDSLIDVENKLYAGEPFIDGKPAGPGPTQPNLGGQLKHGGWMKVDPNAVYWDSLIPDKGPRQ